MDIFPVTNEKYTEFILADGYGNQSYWSDAGWTWKTTNQVKRPEYWNDPKWNQPNHPVVGVSFHEAKAYANWAGRRLPTEQEWEKVARGTDGRMYPWGNAFDSNNCNSSESGIQQTTPVTAYSDGVSPHGCYDMAGNVWEWCESQFNEDESRRVIRGGSWFNLPVEMRASYRSWYFTDVGNDSIGFRLAQDIE